MIKIVANVSKKVPIPNLDYSSQQFMCGMEIEVGDGATAEQIQGRVREIYQLLETSIDAEIRAAKESTPAAASATTPANTEPRDRPSSSARCDRQFSGERRERRFSGDRYANRRPRGGNGNGGNGDNGDHEDQGRRNGGHATQAQVRAIHAIAKANGWKRDELHDYLADEFQKDEAEELTVREASDVIEYLKVQQTRR